MDPRASRGAARAVGLGIALTMLATPGCERGQLPEPDASHLRQPTGLRLSPEGGWLFVTNGNWDRVESGGTLMAIDLDAVERALAATPAGVGDELSTGRPCRNTDEGGGVECDESAFIDPGRTVVLPSALGNIGLDMPAGAGGPLRLLVPAKVPASVTWIDVVIDSGGAAVDCGQDEDGRCDAAHIIDHEAADPDEELPIEPARIVVDTAGFRLAYLPHLLEGKISLLTLDGERGPELTDIETDFYREDPFDDFDAAGGFSVAQRACDVAADNAPSESRDCARPFLYTTHRFWPGIRMFTVAPGRNIIVPGANASVLALEPDVVESRPFMGDLAFEDPATGERLLVVQTTPAALVRLDTTLEDGVPVNAVLGTVKVCDNPNHLAIDRPESGERTAFVSCFSDGQIAVVALDTFSVIATIDVGKGANEVVVDSARRLLYVANTRESTISVVGLDRARPGYLTERARLGVGATRGGS